MAGHGADVDGLLFRPFRNQRAGNVMQGKAKATALTPGGGVLGSGGALHEAVGPHRGEHGAACLAHDSRHLCAEAQRGHCEGAGVAGARQHQHDSGV